MARLRIDALKNGEGFVIVDDAHVQQMTGPYRTRKQAEEGLARLDAVLIAEQGHVLSIVAHVSNGDIAVLTSHALNAERRDG